ncbi:restriction endonuclease subunit S, partial [Moraxella catarrhalis]
PQKDINHKPSIIVKSRGIIEFEYYDKPFSHKNEMWAYHSQNPNINIKFIYYFLKQNEPYFQKIGSKMQMPQIATPDTDKFKIPIPPLSVQSQIVQILDAFTELNDQLTAELSMRQKQYQYYRDLLLSEHKLAKVGFEWKSLGEVAKYSNDRILFSELDENNHIGVDNLLQNRMGKIPSNHVPEKGTLIKYVENDILIGNIRPYLKKIWQADQVGGTNGDVLVIHPTDKQILPRFLYQVLADDKFFAYNMQYAKGAKMPRGNKQSILKYPIPIPPLSVQSEIVAILDTFDTLTQSISEGLPKEIKLRQKQYEYYREQLLNFKATI